MTVKAVVFDIGAVLVDWQPHLAWMDELGSREAVDAFMDRKVLLQLYLRATDTKHSFWFVNLLNEKDAMFHKKNEQKMLVIDK